MADDANEQNLKIVENPVVSANAEAAGQDAVTLVADNDISGADGAADESWVLDLGDLIADARGEVVVSDLGGAHLTITANEGVASSGQMDGHVTQEGLDVTGFQFVTFENGITLYYDDGVNLALSA